MIEIIDRIFNFPFAIMIIILNKLLKSNKKKNLVALFYLIIFEITAINIDHFKKNKIISISAGLFIIFIYILNYIHPVFFFIILIFGFLYNSLSKILFLKYILTIIGVLFNLYLVKSIIKQQITNIDMLKAITFVLCYDLKDDIMDIDEDTIVGRNTIANVYGKNKSKNLLIFISIISIISGAISNDFLWANFIILSLFGWNNKNNIRWPRILIYPVVFAKLVT